MHFLWENCDGHAHAPVAKQCEMMLCGFQLQQSATMTTVRVSPESILEPSGGRDKDLLSPLTNRCRTFQLIFLLYGIVPLRLNKRSTV